MTETVALWLKLGGAAVGSSIAVVFRPGGDSWLKLAQRFVIGTILGFISAPVVIDTLGWKHSPDYWLASATLGGLIGYLLLQVVFSRETMDLVKRKLKGTK